MLIEFKKKIFRCNKNSIEQVHIKLMKYRFSILKFFQSFDSYSSRGFLILKKDSLCFRYLIQSLIQKLNLILTV